MRDKMLLSVSVLAGLLFTGAGEAQITERERPEHWSGLLHGGRFMDRFLPIPVQGALTSDTWGAEGVVPRYTDDGICAA